MRRPAARNFIKPSAEAELRRLHRGEPGWRAGMREDLSWARRGYGQSLGRVGASI